jgi:hypothetical protein
MNGIDAVERSVEFIHIPVPKHADEEFFAAMQGWHNVKGARLYLGLLQHDDEAGDNRRIAAAHRVVKAFGVAAECGFGRTDPANVSKILASHRRAARHLQTLGR